MPYPPVRPTIRRLSVASAVVALIVYWLVWSGLPHAVDELSALSVSESMWAGDGFTVNQMEWDQARTPPQNSPGIDGSLYSKKGLGVSIAALPLWAAGSAWLDGGAVRVALLTGSLLAAASVGLMVWTVQRLGYRNRTALLAGATLAFGTLLFPYARTLFSEAIAAPALVLALGAALVWRAQGANRDLLAFAAGLGVAGVLLPKSSNGIIALFFVVYMAAAAWRASERSGAARVLAVVRQLVWFGLPVAVAGVATIGYNWVRFGTLAGFPLEPFEQFSTPLLTGLAGLLVSPGKGLIWYMPLTLLAAAGAIWTIVRAPQVGIRRGDALLALASIASVIVLYALWYDWPGGRAWGPRMIAWVGPALVLLALPAIDLAAMARPPLWARAVVWGVLGLSVLAQIPGVLVNFEAREAIEMNAGVTFDALLWQASHTPLLRYWGAIFSPTVEPLILQGASWRLAPFGMLLFLALLGVSIWLLYRHLAHRNLGAIWTALLLSVVAGFVLVTATDADPRWQDDSANPEDNAALVEFLATRDEGAASDLLVFDLERERQVQSRAWWRQNVLPAGDSFVGWLRRTEAEIVAAPEDFALLDAQINRHWRTWLVLQETPEGDPASTTEKYLNALYFRGADVWLGAQRVVSYYRWSSGEALAGGEEVEFIAPGGASVRLNGWSIYAAEEQGAWLVLLDWQEGAPQSLRYSLQALDASGALLSQIDRAPTDAFGKPALDVAAATRIILKVYDSESGEGYLIDGMEAVTLWQE